MLTEIDRFDARRGYKRYNPPRIGISVIGNTASPVADFWRNPQGGLVGRLSCAKEHFWFEATRATGADIRQEDTEQFKDYICEILLQWLVEGVHAVDCISDFVR